MGATGRSPGEPKAVEVSWYSRLRNLVRNALKGEVPMRDRDATDDYPTSTLLSLDPGALRLRKRHLDPHERKRAERKTEAA